MKRVHLNAAGIDIGSRKVFVSVEGERVKSYFTFTIDFKELAVYLTSKGVETVAMEATGVYWVVLYDILTSSGFDVWLVDGRQTKQVPGRKTDVKDCQWIQQLHSYGLLNKCFVSTGSFRTLRSYQRLREDHIRSSSMHINHMHKALIEMNIRLPEVLSQTHGKSGMRMIEAILLGERNAEILLELCDTRLKRNKGELILKALEGHYSVDGIFKLQQAYDAYYFYQKQIWDCDKQMELVLEEINEDKDDIPKEKLKGRKPIRHNKPQIANLSEHMLKAFQEKDATTLPGITDYSSLQLLSEIGADLTKWITEKHFTSWLSLSPGQHHSGKMKRNKRKGHAKAGQIFRQSAQSILNSKNIALGAFGRRIRARKGPAVAIKAVARKLAEQYWRLHVKGSEYVEKGIEHYNQQLQNNKLLAYKRLDKELGIKQDVIINTCQE